MSNIMSISVVLANNPSFTFLRAKLSKKKQKPQP